PFVLVLMSSIYCLFSLRTFAARHAAFAQLMSTHPALTPDRYLRLSALALTDLMLSTPLAASIYHNTVASPISPWISYFDYGRIEQALHVLWAADTKSRVAIELVRWAPPMYTLVFFALFGFAEEARR
ncbi:GPCR fungal pheromone mating factor, partial [Mycena albidolilacea]